MALVIYIHLYIYIYIYIYITVCVSVIECEECVWGERERERQRDGSRRTTSGTRGVQELVFNIEEDWDSWKRTWNGVSDGGECGVCSGKNTAANESG